MGPPTPGLCSTPNLREPSLRPRQKKSKSSMKNTVIMKEYYCSMRISQTESLARRSCGRVRANGTPWTDFCLSEFDPWHHGEVSARRQEPSSPKAFITSFAWRGSASTQSLRKLHRTVLLRSWSCFFRPAASPIFISYLWVSHSASSLEALTVTSSPWTEALIPRASWSTNSFSLVSFGSESPPRSLQDPIPTVEQRHGCRTNTFSASRTADCLVLLRLLWEARCRLCASPSHGSALFARQSPRAMSRSGCLMLPPR